MKNLATLIGLVTSFLSITSQGSIIFTQQPTCDQNGIYFQFKSNSASGIALFSDETGAMVSSPNTDNNNHAAIPTDTLSIVSITWDQVCALVLGSGAVCPSDKFSGQIHVGISANGTTLGTTLGDDFVQFLVTLNRPLDCVL